MARKGERVGRETRRMTRSSKPWPQRCARTPRTTQNAAPGARAPSRGVVQRAAYDEVLEAARGLARDRHLSAEGKAARSLRRHRTPPFNQDSC